MCSRARSSTATASATAAAGAGDVQWMTAGSGILHQEMPKGDARGRMHGFQLWANLPSSLKMTAPRYQDVSGKDIPEVVDDDGTRVRVICGELLGQARPGGRRRRRPALSRRLGPGRPAQDVWPVETRPPRVRLCVRAARARFRDASQPSRRPDREGDAGGTARCVREQTGNRSLVVFDRGDEVTVQAGDEGIRFLLVSGKPIEEPVAWYGPIVMNTKAELQQAFAELRNGTFIKHG